MAGTKSCIKVEEYHPITISNLDCVFVNTSHSNYYLNLSTYRNHLNGFLCQVLLQIHCLSSLFVWGRCISEINEISIFTIHVMYKVKFALNQTLTDNPPSKMLKFLAELDGGLTGGTNYHKMLSFWNLSYVLPTIKHLPLLSFFSPFNSFFFFFFGWYGRYEYFYQLGVSQDHLHLGEP